MPTHHFDAPRGRLIELEVDSAAVARNRLGDPSRRRVPVYLPPEAASEPDRRFPLLVGLAGFTSSGLKMPSWQLFGESLPQRLDRLRAEDKMGPAIVAMPDCFTRLGGNQYVNSPILGDWETFLIDELVPELERSLPILPGAAHRAVFGKSSGGYGAIVQALKHAEHWGAVACQSGDMGFDVAFRRDLPVVLDRLRKHDLNLAAFVRSFDDAQKVDGGDLFALMFLAFCASYDPDPARPFGVQLPMDPETCDVIEDRWAAWLSHDPVEILERAEAQANLRRLDGALFIDCGDRDQYFLHYGSRQFVRRLRALGIEHHYEEFPDNHSGLDYRLDVSLPFLEERVRE